MNEDYGKKWKCTSYNEKDPQSSQDTTTQTSISTYSIKQVT